MKDINKPILYIKDLLKHNKFTTKVKIYMSTKTYGDDYDAYEDNYTFTNLNYITIKAYVRTLTPETAFYKQYGVYEKDIKEIICEDRFYDAFRKCNKVEIGNDEYEVLKTATGQGTIIKRPYKLIRVTLKRKE